LLVRNTVRFGSPFHSISKGTETLWLDSWDEVWKPGSEAKPPSPWDYLTRHSAGQMARRLGRGLHQEGIFLIVASGQTYLLNERLGLKVWPVGLLVLALAAVTLLRREDRDAALAAAAIGVMFTLFFSWFLIKDIRFIVPVVPVTLILAARGALALFGAGRAAVAAERVILALVLIFLSASAASALAQPATLRNPTRIHHTPPGYFELRDWMRSHFTDSTTYMMGLGQEYRYFWGDPIPGRFVPIPGSSFDDMLRALSDTGSEYLILDYNTLAGLSGMFAGHFELRDGGIQAILPPEGWIPVFKGPSMYPAFIVCHVTLR